MRTPASGVRPRENQAVRRSGTRRMRHRRRPGRWSRSAESTHRAIAVSGADHRGRRPAPAAREGTPRHSHHDSRAAESPARQSVRAQRARDVVTRHRQPPAATASDRPAARSPSPPAGGAAHARRVAARVSRPDDRVEGGRDIVDRRKPVVRRFRQASAYDARQRRRYLGFTSERSGGWRVRTASRVASALSPRNGRRPASIS